MQPALTALAALAAVLGLVWLVGRVARMSVSALPRTSGRLVRHEALALDPRRRLHLVHCDGRAVLLLTGGPQDVVVGWLPKEGDP